MSGPWIPSPLSLMCSANYVEKANFSLTECKDLCDWTTDCVEFSYEKELRECRAAKSLSGCLPVEATLLTNPWGWSFYRRLQVQVAKCSATSSLVGNSCLNAFDDSEASVWRVGGNTEKISGPGLVAFFTEPVLNLSWSLWRRFREHFSQCRLLVKKQLPREDW